MLGELAVVAVFVVVAVQQTDVVVESVVEVEVVEQLSDL